MRAQLMLTLSILLIVVTSAAPQSKLQVNQDVGSKPYVEEVVVESVLHVRRPAVARNYRANTKTNLENGSSITENKVI